MSGAPALAAPEAVAPPHRELRRRRRGRRRSGRRARRLALALLATLLVLAALAGAKLWLGARALIELRAALSPLSAAAAGPLDPAALAGLGPQLAGAHAAARAARDELAPLLPVAGALGRAPRYGAALAAAGPLLDISVELAGAADRLYQAIDPATLPRAGAALGPALVARLARAEGAVDQARSALLRAEGRLAAIPLAELDPALGGDLERLARLLPEARRLLDLAAIAPALLGAERPQTYLLLVQNPDELRATGGFISGVGELTVSQGRVLDLRVDESSAVDDLRAHPYPWAPAPMDPLMGIKLWVFADSNWSPDFPTAAADAVALYRLGRGRAPDHVVALTPEALRLLLAALGPLAVAGRAGPLGAADLAAYARESYNAGYARGERKAFLGPLLEATLGALSALDAARAPALARALLQALDQRHLLVAAGDQAAAAVLARHGWDGAVSPGAGDFLMVVSANVGYNKVNPFVDERLSYTVDLRDPAAPVAELDVRHSNRRDDAGPCRQAVNPLVGPDYYGSHQRGCYWDYLRVLTPPGSALLDKRVAPVPGEWMLTGVASAGEVAAEAGPRGTRLLSALVVVPTQAEAATMLRYRLPPGTLAAAGDGTLRYRLRVQKQAGREPVPVEVRLLLPPDMAVVAVSRDGVLEPGGGLVFRADLRQDVELSLTLRPAAPAP